MQRRTCSSRALACSGVIAIPAWYWPIRRRAGRRLGRSSLVLLESCTARSSRCAIPRRGSPVGRGSARWRLGAGRRRGPPAGHSGRHGLGNPRVLIPAPVVAVVVVTRGRVEALPGWAWSPRVLGALTALGGFSAPRPHCGRRRRSFRPRRSARAPRFGAVPPASFMSASFGGGPELVGELAEGRPDLPGECYGRLVRARHDDPGCLRLRHVRSFSRSASCRFQSPRPAIWSQ